jgi:hypothetical protein
MVTWLKSLRERWAKRREERRATAGERALRENDRQAVRRRQDISGNGPLGPGA